MSWSLPGAQAAPSISITSVNGTAPVDGAATVTAGQTLRVGGTASTAFGLVADAGDSPYVASGGLARLTGSAAGGSGSYRFDWATSAGTLVATSGQEVDLDTTGLATGPVTATLTVTDLTSGETATDTVKAFVAGPATTRVLDVTQTGGPGIPDEDFFIDTNFTTGKVDGQQYRFPFTVAAGMDQLELLLSWGDAGNDYDMRLDGPGDLYQLRTDAATGSHPERLIIEDPEPGSYVAIVNTYLSTGDTFHLTADTTGPAADPRPAIRTFGPLRFEVPETQELKAEATGGTGPLDVTWDLDQDAVYEVRGATVVSDFPLGTRLVTAKVTDAAGYERRETTPVRVMPPGSTLGFSPFVVVGVNDTGINPYHREFSAATYPDASILDATANFTRHPSEYLPGYPADAEALPITLGKGFLPAEDCPDRPQVVTAVSHFANATCAGGIWNAERIRTGGLYWIPGTKIIGARASADDEHPILDDNGHGTGAASVSVGNAVGSCPSCLLMFGEGFYDDWMADQSWIDFSSNSYGNINLTPDLPVNIWGGIDVKGAVERGQTWLFASGNGHGNSFLVPNTTYTQPGTDRPDWILRVGAVDAGSRKPLVGDGGPADISSFGDGYIPSAAAVSDTATDTFGGTSCATPIAAGVFGLVLGAARDALGDNRAGQRGDGVVALGTPLSGSPYLGDGQLTRAELWEAVLKTAYPSTQPVTEASAISPSYPLDQMHYVFGGYGIADPESAARATNVLLGKADLPQRPAEDDFFARDSALRVALDGSWSGYDEQYGAPGASAAEELRDVAPEQVATIDAALRVLDPEHTLAAATRPAETASTIVTPSRAVDGASSSSSPTLLAAPAPGSTHDVLSEELLAVAGNAGVIPGTEHRRFFVRRDACGGTTPNNERISVQDGVDGGNGCRNLLQMGADIGSQGYFFGEEIYPASDGLPITIDPLRRVTGKLSFRGNGGAGFVVTTAQLVSHGAIVGEQRTNQAVTPGTPPVMNLDFPVREQFAGATLDQLTLRVSIDRLYGDMALSLDNPASWVDVPLASTTTRMVQLSLDDPSFTTGALPSAAVDERDGTWGRNVDISKLKKGWHNVYARVQAADGSFGPVSSSSFRVVRVGPVAVMVDLVPVSALGATTTTVNASYEHESGEWSASFDRNAVKLGTYDLVARTLLLGNEIARSAPIRITARL